MNSKRADNILFVSGALFFAGLIYLSIWLYANKTQTHEKEFPTTTRRTTRVLHD